MFIGRKYLSFLIKLEYFQDLYELIVVWDWKDGHIWTSEQIFYCFASCMGVNNTQKYLNGIEEEEICFYAWLSPAL